MGKVEAIRPGAAPNIFRENLAALIEQRAVAERLRDEKSMELAEARLAKHSTERQLADVRKKIGWLKSYKSEPAPERPTAAPKGMASMGGQYWDIRGNQDADWAPPEEEAIPKPDELLALPPLKVLEEAERDALSANYAADIKIGALEAMKAEADGLCGRVTKAIEEAITQIGIPEVIAIVEKAGVAQAELMRHRAVLRLLVDKFHNRFGKDVGPVAAANDFLNRAVGADDWNWSSHPAALIWREAIENLHTDAYAPLPEVK